MQYVDFAAGLLTPVIAVLATYIAWQQWQTNRLRVKHDLYERRLVIYSALIQFLSVIGRNAQASNAEAAIFLQNTRESCFLFGTDIPDYLNTVYLNWVELCKQETMLEGSHRLPVGEARSKMVDENDELLKWFNDQFDIGREKFAPYMTLL